MLRTIVHPPKTTREGTKIVEVEIANEFNEQVGYVACTLSAKRVTDISGMESLPPAIVQALRSNGYTVSADC